MTTTMSEYEEQAWKRLLADEDSRRKSLRTRVTESVAGAVSNVVTGAGEAVRKVPGGAKVADGTDAAIRTALNGAAKAIFMPSIASVSIERRSRKLRKRFPDLENGSPFRQLDLKALDKGRPRQVLPLAGAATAAGASLAITGAQVSTTVSGGATAAVVAGAIAGDVAASLALLGRATAEVAVHYGFDPSAPEEEIFLMGVLSYSTAGSLQGKVSALSALSRLSQQMMRHATWKELEKDVLVKVIQTVFTKMGVKLTHKRLAQVVPILGGLVSAGLSYDMLNRALGDATRIYRVRYLAEKHGLSFEDWIERATQSDQANPDIPADVDDDSIDVEVEAQAAISGMHEIEEEAAPKE